MVESERSLSEEAKYLCLEVLSKTRREPTPGDLFVLKVKGKGYFYGAVVKTGVNAGFGGNIGILVYIYGKEYREKAMVPPVLSREDLLIPPLMVNRKPWTKGFFEWVGHGEVSELAPYDFHCFRDVRNQIVNEYGEIVKKCTGRPVGQYGLASYGAVSREIAAKFSTASGSVGSAAEKVTVK